MSRESFARLAIALLVSLTGCARPERSAPERLAVITFGNLSSSREFDWLGRALSVAVASDLTGLREIYAQPVDSLDGAYGMQASRAVEGYFVQSNGRFAIHAAVLDLASRKTAATFELEGPIAQGSIPLANALAKKLSPEARAFQASSETAFRAYGEALAGGDAVAVLHALETAENDDPRLSLAALERAQILAAGGDRTAAIPVIEAARQHQLDPITSARLDLLAASIRGDRAAQEKNLETLARLTPADPKIFEELAQVKLRQRKFPDAARNYESASRANPEDTQVLNELGYARAYAGDLNGARNALEEYRRLTAPENVNPLDSLGEVSFYLGDFGAAEKHFLDADKKNPGEFAGADLLKAAQARLMSGDLAGADVLFGHYAEREQRGQAAIRKAQWAFLTGRRRAAMEELEHLLPSAQGDGKSLLAAQLSVWKLETGDRKGAADLADQSAASAASAAARNLSAICRAISHPETNTPESAAASGYARLFTGRFGEAVPYLEAVYRANDPHNDGEIRTMLAWSYVKAGRTMNAAPLIRTYPIPLSAGESIFASWIFPRYLFVRGEVLRQEGKRAEAKAAYELFLKYAGDIPDAFGDEAAARKNLSAL